MVGESTHLPQVLPQNQIVINVRLEKLQTRQQTQILLCVSLAYRTRMPMSLAVLHVDRVVTLERRSLALHCVANAMRGSTC